MPQRISCRGNEAEPAGADRARRASCGHPATYRFKTGRSRGNFRARVSSNQDPRFPEMSMSLRDAHGDMLTAIRRAWEDAQRSE